MRHLCQIRLRLLLSYNVKRHGIEEKKKILDLLTEIGTESTQIIARCEPVGEPWFWENSQGKVITV